MNRISRRGFLKRSAAASSGVSAGLGSTAWLRAAGANDAVRLGVVGVGSRVKSGGMGRNEIRHFRAMPGVRVVALCDVDSDNFIDAVRSRRAADLAADILDGHLSAALVHLGNISHRVGRAVPEHEIGERVEGNRELAAAYQRLKAHLSANGVDLDKTPATLGAMLTFDPQTERFVGELSQPANELVARQYRQPFEVPQQV